MYDPCRTIAIGVLQEINRQGCCTGAANLGIQNSRWTTVGLTYSRETPGVGPQPVGLQWIRRVEAPAPLYNRHPRRA